jgi:hypothetical protein
MELVAAQAGLDQAWGNSSPGVSGLPPSSIVAAADDNK